METLLSAMGLHWGQGEGAGARAGALQHLLGRASQGGEEEGGICNHRAPTVLCMLCEPTESSRDPHVDSIIAPSQWEGPCPRSPGR